MNSNVKYFLYIAGSVFVFILLIKSVYTTGLDANKASAFEWEKQVNIYLIDKNKVTESTDCTQVIPVSRTVLNAETLGPGALEALLKGPTMEEAEMGMVYESAIKEGTLLQKFEVKNGVAFVDFNSTFNEGVAGSCTVLAIRSQIENTLNALPDIDSVVISVNGETEGILEP